MSMPVEIDLCSLMWYADWHRIVASITHQVEATRLMGESIAIHLPDFIYDSFLGWWACGYLTPTPIKRHERWINKLLRRFNLTVIEPTTRELRFRVDDQAVQRLRDEMKERQALIVNGRFIPIIKERESCYH